MSGPRKIFATIRSESKYRNQQPIDKEGNVVPFPVALDFVNDPFWPVKGGIGDNYALYDVDLWVFTGEKLERLLIHSKADESIPLSRLGEHPTRFHQQPSSSPPLETIEEYTAAVIELIKLARQGTSGGRAAAQVLLSAYNGDDFQLNIVDLNNMDRSNHELAMTVIHGRYDTMREPHEMVTDGGKIFRELWDRWEHLHVEERGKRECPDCNGRGKIYLNPEDDTDMSSKPCPSCEGKGRICRCKP